MSRQQDLRLLCPAAFILLTLSLVTSGQPILPSLSYPVFVYAPSLPQQPDSATSNIPEEGFEVSQFHSQDELGRVVFGFHSPDQSRMEARALDGSVRGSYSYIDPYGHIVKMQYWDDGTGFHVAGNALPGGSPPYTPEVAAAREQHFKIYKQTLAAAQQMMPQSDESAFADSPDSDPSIGISQGFEDMSQFHKEQQDNSLFEDDKESISLENPELFGNHNAYQEDERKDEKKPEKEEVEGEVDLGEDIVPDDIEEEAYENDQFEINNHKFGNEERERIKDYNDGHDVLIRRLKHSANNRQKDEHEQQNEDEGDKQEADEANQDKDEEDTLEEENKDFSEGEENESAPNPENGNSDEESSHSDQRMDSIEDHEKEEEVMSSNEDDYDPETSENKHTEVQLLVHPIVQPQTEVADLKLVEPAADQMVDTSNTDTKSAAPKRRGFFYHFQHTIPRPTERIEQAVERGLQSAAAIKIPPSAMHDPQLSPYHFINRHMFPQV